MPQSALVKRDVRQGNSVIVKGLAPLLKPASENVQPTPEGTVLGPGKEASSSQFDALTYGAIVYDYDAASKVYVIYGIGRKGDQAIVAYSWASNQ
jgi:hypothetical protein